MKKVVLIIFLLSFCVDVAYAKDFELYFTNGKKDIKSISVKKNEKFSLYVKYKEKEDFDVMAVLGSLDFGSKDFELVSYKGLNDFTITIKKFILMDRFSIGQKYEDTSIVKLDFKALRSGNKKISIKTATAANVEHEISIDDISVDVKVKKRVIDYVIIALIFIGGVVALLATFLFVKKFIKRKKHKK